MKKKGVDGGGGGFFCADLAMVTYYPGYTDEHAVIVHANRNRKGILIKKALASGHLHQLSAENPVETSMRFVLSEPGVTSVIVGTINADHLRENAAVAAAFSV